MVTDTVPNSVCTHTNTHILCAKTRRRKRKIVVRAHEIAHSYGINQAQTFRTSHESWHISFYSFGSFRWSKLSLRRFAINLWLKFDSTDIALCGDVDFQTCGGYVSYASNSNFNPVSDSDLDWIITCFIYLPPLSSSPVPPLVVARRYGILSILDCFATESSARFCK